MNLVQLCLIFSLAQILNAAFSLIDIEKAKDLKKTIATKTNLLVLYATNTKNADVVAVRNLFKMVDSSFAVVDCSNKDLKKLCKKSLPEGKPVALKHYKDGAFNKDYDRQLTKNSLSTFMRDPTGDIPFDEDPSSKDVVHLFDVSVSSSHEISLDIIHHPQPFFCIIHQQKLFCFVFLCVRFSLGEELFKYDFLSV